MKKTIQFPQIAKPVNLMYNLGSGVFRDVYATDYEDAEGRSYVCKVAMRPREVRYQFQGEIPSRHNKFEYNLFQALLKTDPKEAEHYAKCIAISGGGKYLLMEQAVIAEGIWRERYEECTKTRDASKTLHALQDMHDGNFGFSLFDDRLVMLDYAGSKDEHRLSIQEDFKKHVDKKIKFL